MNRDIPYYVSREDRRVLQIVRDYRNIHIDKLYEVIRNRRIFAQRNSIKKCLKRLEDAGLISVGGFRVVANG